MSKVSRGCLFAASLLLLCPFVGCGTDAPELVPVSGTVTRSGQPVPNAVVTFQPTKGRNSIGYTDEEGHYTLQFTRELDGACVGKHRVMITFEGRPQTPEAEQAVVLGLPLPKHPEQTAISKKYGPEKSTLEVEVNASTPVIDLKLD